MGEPGTLDNPWDLIIIGRGSAAAYQLETFAKLHAAKDERERRDPVRFRAATF